MVIIKRLEYDEVNILKELEDIYRNNKMFIEFFRLLLSHNKDIILLPRNEITRLEIEELIKFKKCIVMDVRDNGHVARSYIEMYNSTVNTSLFYIIKGVIIDTSLPILILIDEKDYNEFFINHKENSIDKKDYLLSMILEEKQNSLKNESLSFIEKLESRILKKKRFNRDDIENINNLRLPFTMTMLIKEMEEQNKLNFEETYINYLLEKRDFKTLKKYIEKK